ncbi:MAG: TOBE domain-containing protein, partial [Gemmatimonadales bacterium]
GRAVDPPGAGWLVERGQHRYRVPPHPAIAAGATVDLAIRPEWMDLFRPGEVPAEENGLPGVVHDVIYLGETIHILADLDGGGQLKVAVRNEGQLAKPVPWRRADPVVVAWLPEDCQVLQPE